jgi:hypothetical protein
LLVPAHRVEAAELCLRQMGYTTEEEHETLRPFFLQHHHHLPPLSRMRERRKVSVEIQWRASPCANTAQMTDRMWQTSLFVQWGDPPPIRVLSPVFLFVRAILDIWTHQFEKGIRPFCDLWSLACRPTIEGMWEMIADEIQRLRIAVETTIALTVTGQLFGKDRVPWSQLLDNQIHIPQALLSAAYECTLHSYPDTLLTWTLVARSLEGCNHGFQKDDPPTVLSNPLVANHRLLFRSVRQLWRVMCTFPKCRGIIRNECARIAIAKWSRSPQFGLRQRVL